MRRASKLLVAGTVVLVAVIVATGLILAGADRRSLRDRAEADGVLTAQLIAGNGGATLSALQDIEDAEGRHMVSEATIAAHLVAIAEAAGLKPDQINSRLKAIATPNSPLDEFWITDEKGHAYLRNLDVDFTFNPDPKVQPQRLLAPVDQTAERRDAGQPEAGDRRQGLPVRRRRWGRPPPDCAGGV